MSLTPFRRLVDRFYPRPDNGCKIPLLGLDASGKTTLLYRLKIGEIVTTIPTIGFNIEMIQVPAGNSGRLITMQCWDAGGCTKFGPSFVRLFAASSDALIWIVDSSDRDRIVESVEELLQHIRTFTSFPDDPAPKDLPVLIIATKQDLPNAIPIDEIRAKFKLATTESPYFIIGTSATQSVRDAPFTDAFGWLLTAIEEVRAGRPPGPPPVPAVSDPRFAAALESKLEEWLARAENDSAPDEFLHQFETLSLPAWDHYTHIRIAYLFLTIHGRQKGKNLIFDGLEKYISQSEQTRGRTFHVTMTYFYIQMVHFGICSMPPAPTFDDASISSMQTLVGEEKAVGKQDEKSGDEFAHFLLTNPHLVDGDLWAQYYSKGVMMSPEAKAGMVLPDKKSLPNLVARETVSSAGLSKK
ncbi:ADP-ribosylation factor [Mycena vitilis]|nr:ADP-ribosylation factor [Mycena vitilis]